VKFIYKNAHIVALLVAENLWVQVLNVIIVPIWAHNCKQQTSMCSTYIIALWLDVCTTMGHVFMLYQTVIIRLLSEIMDKPTEKKKPEIKILRSKLFTNEDYKWNQQNNCSSRCVFQIRIICTILISVRSKLNLKEKIFVALSWMAKATVQVSVSITMRLKFFKNFTPQ